MKYTTCQVCSKPFQVCNSRLKTAKYCSKTCHNKGMEKAVRYICPTCKKEFKPKHKNSKHCSRKCFVRTPEFKKCQKCGKSLTKKQQGWNAKYCSLSCANNIPWNKGRGFLKAKCQKCGRTFVTYTSCLKRGWGKFCSKSCANSINSSGREFTEETRRKLSEAHAGKKLSISHKKKMSKTRTGRYRGKESPRWKPSITDEERSIKRAYPEYKRWRELVYERDNYTCQVCNARGAITLHAHHINSYHDNKDLRTNVNNGLTVCKPCHKRFHKIYGYKNTKKQLDEFLTGELIEVNFAQ